MSDPNIPATEVGNPAVKPEEVAVEPSNGNRDKSPSTSEQAEELNGDSEEKSKDRDEERDDRYEEDYRRDDPRARQKSRHQEFEDLPESDDPDEIREQVEFYFSNANLAIDEHMFFETGGPKNWPVPIKHLHTFKRMHRFQPYSAVVSALRDSKVLEVVDHGKYSGAGNESVKRKVPIVLENDGGDQYVPTSDKLRRFRAQSTNNLEASIYAKGFGDEEVNQLDVERFFKPYGAIMVKKRIHDKTKIWKGSVFVEFDSVEAQKQFLLLDPKPKWDGNELLIMGKKEYNDMKCKEKGIKPGRQDDGNQWRNGNRGHGGRGHGRGRGRGGRGRGNRGSYHDRGNHRDHRDHHRSRNDRSRSPRRSPDGDRDDWNGRRDDFQKTKEFKQDSEEVASNKRKADDAERDDGSKKTKIEIKEDE